MDGARTAHVVPESVCRGHKRTETAIGQEDQRQDSQHRQLRRDDSQPWRKGARGQEEHRPGGKEESSNQDSEQSAEDVEEDKSASEESIECRNRVVHAKDGTLRMIRVPWNHRCEAKRNTSQRTLQSPRRPPDHTCRPPPLPSKACHRRATPRAPCRHTNRAGQGLGAGVTSSGWDASVVRRLARTATSLGR